MWSPHTVGTQTLIEEVHVDHLRAGGGERAEEAGQGDGGEHLAAAALHRQAGGDRTSSTLSAADVLSLSRRLMT